MSVVRLIGHDISYSASPAMQGAAFEALALHHRYELADMTTDELPEALATLRDGGFLGANVTVPHKEAVLDLLDEVEPLAAETRAVNTILVREGRLIGKNTDVPAVEGEIRRLRNAPAKVVILGAGGAARAVAIALNGIGNPEVAMVSRANRSELSGLLEDADLLVNATPVGTRSEESPIEPDLLHRGLAVLDLVYRPSPTRLVHDARARGLPARAGAGVLLGQGWRSLEVWLGTTVADHVKRAMADALCRELGAGADV